MTHMHAVDARSAALVPVMQVFDGGSVYDPKVLDITQDDLKKSVTSAIQRVAAACLAVGYPTLASIPHSVINGYKRVLAVSVETDYTFPLAEKARTVCLLLAGPLLMHMLLLLCCLRLCCCADSQPFSMHAQFAEPAVLLGAAAASPVPQTDCDSQQCTLLAGEGIPG